MFSRQNQWVVGHYQGSWGDYQEVLDWDDEGKTINFNQFYNLEVHLEGPLVILKVDGETLISTEFDAPLTSNVVGLAAANAFCWFDNFTINFETPLRSPVDTLFSNWEQESASIA
ncbi:MAG: hypothetical protein R3C11_01120 [Planctomycetaceae bacterium]